MTEQHAHEEAAEHRDRRRIAEVFGDVLPETTSDERAEYGDDERGTDRWYRENRPPHH